MSLMSVSQYAKHAGMSRQALYNWESHEGFPARVDGKIDQEACDTFWPDTAAPVTRVRRMPWVKPSLLQLVRCRGIRWWK